MPTPPKKRTTSAPPRLDNQGKSSLQAENTDADLVDSQKNPLPQNYSCAGSYALTCPLREFANAGAKISTRDIGEDLRVECEHFQVDVEQWVSQVSEAFHVVAFIREMIGQTLFSFFGPFSFPIILPLYGYQALLNRGFLPSCRLYTFFVLQFILWLAFAAVMVIYIYFQPDDLRIIEVKMVVFTVFLRQVAIAIRYAYMTTENYTETLYDVLPLSRLRASLLGPAWFKVSPITALFYAEISFVGVIGSKSQRDTLLLKFLPYAQSDNELSELQARMDVSSRRLILQPTGIANPKSPHRKVERKQCHKNACPEKPRRPSLLKRLSFSDRYSIDDLATKREDSGLTLRTNGSKLSSASSHGSLEEDVDPRDKKLFDHACAGGSIPLEDMFLYMIRALLRSEEAQIPPRRLQFLMHLVGFLVIMMPSLTRVMCGKHMFGSTENMVFVICTWMTNAPAFNSVCLFIGIGGKDMWRRRALFRSCAALLTLQRFYRHGCLAEVDLLPALDVTDPNTIEAWRKLRQLCRDWGRTFLLRVQAFAAVFFLSTLLMAADLVASLEIPTYTKMNNVTLTHMALVGSLLLTMFGALCILVYLGQDVNKSSFRHAALLQRQRLVIVSQRHRTAYDAMVGGRKLSTQDSKLARVVDLLDILAQDVMSEHGANPIKLLGMYCGYELLSALYFLPAIIFTSVTKFCTADATWERCISA